MDLDDAALYLIIVYDCLRRLYDSGQAAGRLPPRMHCVYAEAASMAETGICCYCPRI